MKIHFLPARSNDAQAAFKSLTEIYGQALLTDANVIVALGGDGTLLEALKVSDQDSRTPGDHLPIYGMNKGSVGFLMNSYCTDNLVEKINGAQKMDIHPLAMTARDDQGQVFKSLAYNEVSLLREMRQAAKIRILIDDTERLPELICDGILVATPVGSTAYNLSAHGPIIPLKAQILALTPISAFRPRHWRGALLPNTASIRFEILEAEKRPVSATADDFEVRNVRHVEIRQALDYTRTLLFDADLSLEERILKEQFLP